MTTVPRDDAVTMRSPEGVEIELPIATPAPRIAAYAIDGVLVAVVMFALFMFLALGTPLFDWFSKHMAEWVKATGKGDAEAAAAMLAPVLIALMIAFTFGECIYFSMWEASTRGLTPGKYVMRLRVVGSAGQPLDVKTAVLRNVMRAVDVLPSSYCVGLIAMMVSKRGQRLGDHAAGSLVIRTDRVERPLEPLLPEGLEPLALSREQLARLGARELTLVRGALRRLQSGSGTSSALIEQVSEALATRLQVPPEERQDPVRFLQRALITAQRVQRR